MANVEREQTGRMRGRVRVLVVDDSALMRRLLTDLLGSAPEIEVVGVARDGREAVVAGGAAQAGRDHARRRDAGGLGPGGAAGAPGRPRGAGRDGQRPDAGGGRGDACRPSSWAPSTSCPSPSGTSSREMRASRDLLVAKVLAAAQSRVRRPRRAAAPPATTSAPPTRRRPAAATGHPRHRRRRRPTASRHPARRAS